MQIILAYHELLVLKGIIKKVALRMIKELEEEEKSKMPIGKAV
jgi:hypothetical protein